MCLLLLGDVTVSYKAMNAGCGVCDLVSSASDCSATRRANTQCAMKAVLPCGMIVIYDENCFGFLYGSYQWLKWTL